VVWNTLRQEDVLTSAPASLLLAGLVASLVIYGGLLIGWIRMLVHAARYGVVPVRKPGVRP
jgi:cytochrome d ubiquinol oxidase subunit I